MSTLSSLSPRDLERLSAYADGELAPQEAERLRARLDQDPRLRQALAEVQQTAGLLRSLPTIQPPRPFTLSAGRATAARRYPRLQLATAVASLAFFLVAGVDVLTSTTRMAAPSLQLAQERAAEPPQEIPLPAAELEQAAPEEGLLLAPLEATGAPAVEAPLADAVGTPAPLGQSAPAEPSAAATPLATEGPTASAEAPSTAPTPLPTEVAAAPPQTATSHPVDEDGEARELTEAAGTPEGAYRAAQAAAESATEAAALEFKEQNGSVVGDDLAAAAELAAPEAGAAPAELGNEAASSQVIPPQPGPAGLILLLLEAGFGSAALVLAVLTVRARRQR